MVGRQPNTESFTNMDQMANIGAAIVTTRVAIAIRIQRSKVMRIFRIFNDEPAAAGHASTISGNPSW